MSSPRPMTACLPERTSSPLRVGVLLPSQPAKWIPATLAAMTSAGYAEVVAVAVVPGGPLVTMPLWQRAWVGFDQWLFGPSKNSRTGDAVVPLLSLPCVTPARLSGERLDVLVDFSGLAPTEVLTCARYGVWSFNPPESESAFEELYGKLVSTVTLRRHRTNGTQVIYHGSFARDPLSLLRNRLADESRRSSILLRALADLHARGTEPVTVVAAPCETTDATAGPMVRKAGDTSFPRWLVRWSSRIVRQTLPRLACGEQWQIAYRTCPEKLDSADAGQFRFLQPPAGIHYADPFAIEQNDARHIFFERWADGAKGEIWCVALDERNQAGEPQRALVRPYHLSYPFVFAWRGEIYMLPETAQNRTVELYRAVSFPLTWERCAVLRRGEAVDSSIFEYQGRWWMCTGGLGGSAFRHSELSLFWATSPLGPWHPHPRNPVVCDVRRGRPAGAVFFAGGELIRPGQDCSRGYGYGITLSRIDVLSTVEYRETPVKTIEPDFAHHLCGVHTLNRSTTLEVLDFKLRIRRYRKSGADPVSRLVKTSGWLEHGLRETRIMGSEFPGSSWNSRVG